MKLTNNFTLAELLKSATATRHGFTEQFTPPAPIVNNLTMLCREVLQPLRDAIGSPLRVTSGYRCTRLNEQVGGSKTSDHVKGLAADIEGANEELIVNVKLVDCQYGKRILIVGKAEAGSHPVYINAAILLIIAYNLEGKFCQLISEHGSEKKCNWVHVSVPEVGKVARGQILRKAKGRPYTALTKEQLFASIVSN